MNEVVESKVAESIDILSAYVNQGVEFVLTEAPLLAVEIIHWGIAYGLAWTAVGAIILIATYRFHRFIQSSDDHDPEFLYFCAVPIGAIGFVVFFHSLLGVVKAIVAPRLFLMEKLADMVS